MDINKLPKIQARIIRDFLAPLNPDMSTSCQLNILNAKVAQMMTFKRPRVKKTPSEKPAVVNYYALNFISSGGGKDKVLKEIDDYLLYKFKAFFNEKNKEYKKVQRQNLEQSAIEYNKNESEQKTYLKEGSKKIRDLRFEVGDATPEGLRSDAESLVKAGYGGVFVRNNEFGELLDHPSPAQTALLSELLKAYDAKIDIKSIKGESDATEVDGIPFNLLAYSDTDKLKQGKAEQCLNQLLSTGFARRVFLTYMPDVPLNLDKTATEQIQIQEQAYREAKVLSEELFEAFNALAYNTEFQLTDEAYVVYYNYEMSNKEAYNKLLNSADKTWLKEIRNRHWKALKLSALIACLEHPADSSLYPQDVKMAIYQTEAFAEDFEGFFETRIESDTDKLFKYFISNKDKWVTKQDIRNQGFINKNLFAKWLSEQIPYIHENAEKQGYILREESFNNNTGMRYSLIESNIGKALSAEVIPIGELLCLQ